jgi:hypothetical protein
MRADSKGLGQVRPSRSTDLGSNTNQPAAIGSERTLWRSGTLGWKRILKSRRK